ncbi:response regulator [Saccharibacillus sp. CPCC 101409]|uniref:helix-turn-helix domain-containing protein n=1 Tax=Saccharibacillus sp. CPCC 101409 TaxID=3058041 RepID=UPI002671B929|nr:helix-turn-helix domain-containing protein [Saccharibacillus sp. CPCC 101409]MDO3408937.1 response regulator [Saccharibacillus sp. CPCC 101409]
MKLVLVDDEKGIVEGLKKMIGRYLPDCRIVGTAYNGEDGFKLVQKKRPDIVITDIRMPQSDGLDMIKRLKEAGSQAKFILLSGYADFEYARTGIQLGVKFYINKPVEEEELRDSVNQVARDILTERSKLREIDDLKEEALSRMQENLLSDILDNGLDDEAHLAEVLQSANIQTEGIRFVCALIEFGEIPGSSKDFGFKPALDEISEALKRYGAVYRIRRSMSQIAVVIAHEGTAGYADIVLAIRGLKKTLNAQAGRPVTIGIGTFREGAAGIGQSFEEARYALSHKVVRGEGTVIPYPETAHAAEEIYSVPQEPIGRLEAGLDNLNEAECVSAVREIFRNMQKQSGMSPRELQLQCLNILLLSVRKMSFQQLQQNDILGRRILSLEGISSFSTLESLETWMIEVIGSILAFKTKHRIPRKKDIIAEVKEYVLLHYGEAITLADLASRFFISPYYLSQLFKQKTGETYINFLGRVRVERAKELLEKTDLKVYEICAEVGYSDTQHFARLFEKLTGLKPSEYRRSRLRI